MTIPANPVQFGAVYKLSQEKATLLYDIEKAYIDINIDHTNTAREAAIAGMTGDTTVLAGEYRYDQIDGDTYVLTNKTYLDADQVNKTASNFADFKSAVNSAVQANRLIEIA